MEFNLLNSLNFVSGFTQRTGFSAKELDFQLIVGRWRQFPCRKAHRGSFTSTPGTLPSLKGFPELSSEVLYHFSQANCTNKAEGEG